MGRVLRPFRRSSAALVRRSGCGRQRRWDEPGELRTLCEGEGAGRSRCARRTEESPARNLQWPGPSATAHRPPGRQTPATSHQPPATGHPATGCSPRSGCVRGAGGPWMALQAPLTLPLPMGRSRRRHCAEPPRPSLRDPSLRCAIPPFAEPPALFQRHLWSALKSGVRACTLTAGRLYFLLGGGRHGTECACVPSAPSAGAPR
jgi:hypothetical protein